MRLFQYLFTTIMLVFINLVSRAQFVNPTEVEMAGVLHQNGKIYLVVLVLVTIFAGIIFLLLRIERQLQRLEKKQKEKNN